MLLQLMYASESVCCIVAATLRKQEKKEKEEDEEEESLSCSIFAEGWVIKP